MKQYVCSICGYIYAPEIGDEDNGIESGTPFEDLPYEWTCPICNATKESFEEVIKSFHKRNSNRGFFF